MAWEDDSTQERSTQLVAEAQVHATLALAAATAMQAPVAGHARGMSGPEFTAWLRVAGHAPGKDGQS